MKINHTWLLRGLMPVLAIISMLWSASGHATHFRAASLTWAPVTGNSIVFRAQSSWRRTFFGCIDPSTRSSTVCSDPDGSPALGDLIQPGVVATGDGGEIGRYAVVIGLDKDDNVISVAHVDEESLPAIDTNIDYTYMASGTYTASISGCCRTSENINNPDGNYTVESIVNVGNGNSPPASTLPTEVSCPTNALCSFSVPASDPDGDPLAFALSTNLNQPGPPQAPNAAEIDLSSGLYTWDTTGAEGGDGATYASQITISDLDEAGQEKSRIAVDFFIELTDQVGQPPTFDEPPTPVCGSTLSVSADNSITFDVQASDPEAATVSINAAGLPAGANASPSLPTSAVGTVATNISWTPAAADVGSTVIVFTATDGEGQEAQCPITVEVTNPLRDYGDAPSPFPTLQFDDGPRHDSSALFMGGMLDTETNGQPTADADGDDATDDADEDGVVFTGLVVGSAAAEASVEVTVPGSGFLDAWIDFDGDGIWAEPSERIFDDEPLPQAINNLQFSVPENVSPGIVIGRFRVSSTGSLPFTGYAADGEVEDYQVVLALPTLSIDNVTEVEGDTGVSNYRFTVTLSQAVAQNVTFDYSTADDSATVSNSDYAATSGTETILGGAGITTVTIDVPVQGDTIFEQDEAFSLRLSNPNGATIQSGIGTGTIVNDDSAPVVLTVSDAQVVEGDSGQNNVEFTVSLSEASEADVSFDVATADGTATVADSDYIAKTNSRTTILGGNGITSVPIRVTINGDLKAEADEAFSLTISNASSNATIADGDATGTIVNDDETPVVSLSLLGSPIVEDGGMATVTASLSNPGSEAVVVDFSFAGTATNGVDYSPSATSIVIPAGETSGTLQLMAVDDSRFESNETVIVAIAQVQGATEGAANEVTAVIDDSDDLPQVTLSSSLDSIPEAGGASDIVATLSSASGIDVTVGLNFGGGAESPSDFQSSASQIVIAAGQLSASITVTSASDSTDEGAELIIVSIASVANATDASPRSVEVVILDDDQPGSGESSRDTSEPVADRRVAAGADQVTLMSFSLRNSSSTDTELTELTIRLVVRSGNPQPRNIRLNLDDAGNGQLDPTDAKISEAARFNANGTLNFTFSAPLTFSSGQTRNFVVITDLQ